MTTITIGVSYRTDSNGTMHLDNDCKAILSLKELNAFKELFAGIDIEIRPLPAYAFNQTVIQRSLSSEDILKDLNEVDLLYIPGAPAALDSQIGSSLEEKACKEEENCNKTNPNSTKENDKRKRQEYENRSAYEHKLIDIARTRGMGVLAVCAGSWRLLEGYGGGVRTLPKTERAYHHAKSNVWALKHTVNVHAGSMLHGCLPSSKTGGNAMSLNDSFTSVEGLNSTHWAVARTSENNQLVKIKLPKDSSGLVIDEVISELALNATAETGNKASDTPEGFESVHGVPVMAVQFHPESYLPGMLGEAGASEEIKEFAQRIFLNWLQTGLSYKKRRENNKAHASNQFCEEGLKYYHGIGVVRDMEKAAWNFRLAAAQGHPGAQVKLADILEHGRIGAKELKKAAELYKQAALQENAMAMFCLGHCYEHGKGVEHDLEQAALYYEMAYKRGYEGWTGYFNQFLVKYPELNDYLAANKMTTAQQLSEGLKYYHGQNVSTDMKKAALYLKLAAASGNAKAQVKLADILEHGRIGAKDLKKAAELYKQAALQEDAMAMFCLGHCYEHGKGVERDLEQAALYYEMAYKRGYEGWAGYFNQFLVKYTELNDYLAANRMTTAQQLSEGLKYYHGQNVSTDMKKAALYLKLAAASGNAKAQVKLADILEHGRIGAKDLKKAAELYKQAALQEDAMAMFCLGHCYEHGKGVKQDFGSAAEFYGMAHDKGYEGWSGYFKKFIEGNFKQHLETLDLMKDQPLSSVMGNDETLRQKNGRKQAETIANQKAMPLSAFNKHQQQKKEQKTVSTVETYKSDNEEYLKLNKGAQMKSHA